VNERYLQQPDGKTRWIAGWRDGFCAADCISRRPSFALSSVANDQAMARSLELLDWYVDGVRKQH